MHYICQMRSQSQANFSRCAKPGRKPSNRRVANRPSPRKKGAATVRAAEDRANRAWRIQRAAEEFGSGLIELMRLARGLNAVQRSHFIWALHNALRQLLPDCDLQAVPPDGGKPVPLADYILQCAGTPELLAKVNHGWR